MAEYPSHLVHTALMFCCEVNRSMATDPRSIRRIAGILCDLPLCITLR